MYFEKQFEISNALYNMGPNNWWKYSTNAPYKLYSMHSMDYIFDL